MPLDHVLQYSALCGNFLPVYFISYFVCFMYLYIICLCIVICMHNFHSAHIVYNSVICTKSFNILTLFYNGYIVLNYTAHFVYSSLNSYVYIYWILDFKYILLLSSCVSSSFHIVRPAMEKDFIL